MPSRKINKKNPKEALVNPSHKFTTVSDIKRSLSAQDEASLVHGMRSYVFYVAVRLMSCLQH